MILFLTYHKVLRGHESKPEFYTVQAGQLQRHFELLAQKGLRPLPVAELLGGEAAHEPPIAKGLPTIPPLPFGRGEGRPVLRSASDEGGGEGSRRVVYPTVPSVSAIGT